MAEERSVDQRGGGATSTGKKDELRESVYPSRGKVIAYPPDKMLCMSGGEALSPASTLPDLGRGRHNARKALKKA